MNNILKFIHLAEKLKVEKRNSHNSHGIQESVADHCWRVALMVILLNSSLDKKINVEKALKLALVHDLAEIITGDSPYFLYYENEKRKKEKHIQEAKAIKLLVAKLPSKQRKEITNLWYEFEEKSSYEAQFIHALDKMEAQVQHNEADFKYWNDFDIKYASTLLDSYCDFDSFLKKFKSLIQYESKTKMNKNLAHQKSHD